MSKQLEYINSEIERLEYRIANPIKYNLTPTIKVRIDDSAVYKEELKTLKSVENDIKALEIIVAKKVDIYRLAVADNVASYNKQTEFDEYWLTEEEFKLLKEVLKND
jgi:hypothetical protein